MENEKTARVLIVDDMRVNRMILASLLASNGVESDLAEGGQECIDLCRQRDYDLILLDHRMPDLDGVDTFLKLREIFRERGREVPIVCHTTEDARKNINLYKAAGFADVLIKPIKLQELSHVLMTYLAGYGAALQEQEDAEREQLRLEEAKLPAWVREIPGIDTSAGIAYCETVEDYLDALGIFASSIAVKADEIEMFLREGNISMYTMRVHSLKSTARLIGAKALSEAAANLEGAAKDGDTETVRAETPALLADYRGFQTALAKALRADSAADRVDADALPPEIWEDARTAITDFAANYDAESIRMVLTSLNGYRLTAEQQDFAGRIGAALDQADWEAVRACL